MADNNSDFKKMYCFATHPYVALYNTATTELVPLSYQSATQDTQRKKARKDSDENKIKLKKKIIQQETSV